MTSRFDELGERLEQRIATLSQVANAVVLLSLAQRYIAIFELFESRLGQTGMLRERLARLWAGATGAAAKEVASEVENLVPQEEPQVDGFHDALAQYLGGVAYAAALGLAGEAHEPGYARGVLDALRVLLSEAKFGRLEPGEDSEGSAFEASLHQQDLVVTELREIDALIGAVAGGTDLREMLKAASRSPFDIAQLEPELSQGLERDLRS